MAVGTVRKSTFTDIANAIRAQNGTAERYRPSEMAAAVLALDGTKAGTPLHAAAEDGVGIVSDAAFARIADAIRAQNGLAETYRPAEMAPAILALSWDAGLKMRAILLSDGTLEFNYRDGRSSDVPGAVIVDSWEVDAGGYASAGARPWDDVKHDVVRAVFDADFAQGGLADASFFFNGMPSLVEVRGFEALQGVSKFAQTFGSCGSLESVYATEWAPAVAPTGSYAFNGCRRLVGGGGYVPKPSDGAGKLGLGADGVLTDPAADAREWIRCRLYADGVLELSAGRAPEDGREVAAEGRVCAQARYNALGFQPWYDLSESVVAVELAEDLAGFACVNMDYWFYGHGRISSVAGLSNLRGTREMRYAFASCDALSELDFTGFDETALEDMFYCFSGCGALTTIYADADWALPAGCSGMGAFYGCTALVGGAGTAYASSRTAATYMRVDGGAAAPGYLTAKA